MTWLDPNSRFINPSLKSAIAREVASIARDLKSIGLEVTKEGTITVADRFTTALGTNISTVRSTLTGTDGLFTKLAANLTGVMTNGAQAYARTQEQPARAVSFSVFA